MTAETWAVRQADIGRCPHSIVAPEHFTPPAGQCPCYDPDAAVMFSWGYVWSAAEQMWVADPEEDE